MFTGMMLPKKFMSEGGMLAQHQLSLWQCVLLIFTAQLEGNPIYNYSNSQASAIHVALQNKAGKSLVRTSPG
jgi:hypothetical protein